jgi:hypothetical protein
MPKKSSQINKNSSQSSKRSSGDGADVGAASYLCLRSGCNHAASTADALRRHRWCFHSLPPDVSIGGKLVPVSRGDDNVLTCPFPDCGYGNANRDAFKKHLKKVHENDLPATDEPGSVESSSKRTLSPTELSDRVSKKARLEHGT